MRISLLAAVSVLAIWCSAVGAQGDLATALDRAKDFVSVRQGKAELKSVPVLTTSNPTRGSGEDGTMLLWLRDGLPVAAMSIYVWEGKIMHESDAISRSADFVATSKSGVRWQPRSSGTKYEVLSSEPESQSLTESQRLQKMRAMAKQFEVTMLGFNDQNSDREQLRLLATPVYRYQLKDNREVADGAVFAFVQGTDPEALLIMELVRHDKTFRWEYAIVRATAGALEAKWNGKVVFQAAKFPDNTNPALPHFTFSHTIPEITK